MAEETLSLLLEQVNQIVHGYTNQLTRGEDDVVRWMDYESETLITLLDRIEASTELSQKGEELAESIRDVIRKAQDLARTHTKMEIQRKPHHFKKDVAGWKLPGLKNYQQSPSRDSEAETEAEAEAEAFVSLLKKIEQFQSPVPGEQEQNVPLHRKPHHIKKDIAGRKLHGLKNRQHSPSCDSEAEAEAVEQFQSPVSREQDQNMPLHLKRCMPLHLKRCMHYLLLFPSNYKVPARRLIVLWVAEGLIHAKKHGIESAEQIARGYLNELKRLDVINVDEDKRSGKLKCSIDPSRREELMKKAEKVKFLQGKVKESQMIRRLVDHDNDNRPNYANFIQIQGNPKNYESVSHCRDVISFLSFNTKEGSKPGEEIGDFLRKCISAGCFVSLKVLDLESVFRPKLPDTLGKLIALKYLGLRWTYLEKLPDSVEKLFSLQVLDVKHTYISVLPRSLWRMQYLTHLYLSEAYRTRFPQPPSKVTLTALQTLWGAFVDEDTPIRGGLDTLFNIRKLGLSCRSKVSKPEETPQQSEAIYRPVKMAEQSETTGKPVKMKKQLEAIDKWISNLEFLESLRLKSRNEDNKAADLRLTSLKGNRKLSTLYLLGKLDSILLCRLPASLTNVTLSGSELDLDPLEFLGRLPNLVILRLLGQSVVCSKMYCSKRSFRQLKLLWIWKLEKLEDFEAEEGSLPCLEELEIRSCPNMKNLPHPLLRVQNLEIKLTSMPQKIVQEAKRSKYVKVTDVDTLE